MLDVDARVLVHSRCLLILRQRAGDDLEPGSQLGKRTGDVAEMPDLVRLDLLQPDAQGVARLRPVLWVTAGAQYKGMNLRLAGTGPFTLLFPPRHARSALRKLARRPSGVIVAPAGFVILDSSSPDDRRLVASDLGGRSRRDRFCRHPAIDLQSPHNHRSEPPR